MADSKKIKYLSKTVTFGGKNLTLFSIDGQTWSSRKQELLEIKERQEQSKVSFAAIKEENGETKVVPKVKAKVPYVSSYEEDDDIAPVVVGTEEEFPQVDYSLDGEQAQKSRGKKGKKITPPVKQLISAKQSAATKHKPAAASAKKSSIKDKKKVLKVSPKKRVTGKPKVKAGKSKGKKKAA